MVHVLLFWTSLKDVGERDKKSERRYQLLLTDTIRRRNKTGISVCGLFVVAYFQAASSIDRFHVKTKGIDHWSNKDRNRDTETHQVPLPSSSTTHKHTLAPAHTHTSEGQLAVVSFER